MRAQARPAPLLARREEQRLARREDESRPWPVRQATRQCVLAPAPRRWWASAAREGTSELAGLGRWVSVVLLVLFSADGLPGSGGPSGLLERLLAGAGASAIAAQAICVRRWAALAG